MRICSRWRIYHKGGTYEGLAIENFLFAEFLGHGPQVSAIYLDLPIKGRYDVPAMSQNPPSRDKDAFRMLFNPRSVAVIGASANPMKMGHQCLLSLRESAFPGPVYPIHSRLKEILGMPAYPGLSHVSGDVDLAVLVIPASEVISALQACQAKGVKGAVVITAGFREIESPEGEQLQQKMAAVANRGGMKIIGPNTFGMVNLHAHLNASFTPIFSRLKPGGISLISQSGGVAHLIAYQALREGVGLAKVVGLGNRCNVDFADLLPFLEEDEQTQGIILFIEGLDNPRALVGAVKKVVVRKPVVAMKSGEYAGSSRAARSHTGSMAGRYEIYAGALKQAGALLAQDPTELLDMAKILTILPPSAGENVAVLSFQAGPGILLTDAVQRHGLRMAVFSPQTQEKLDKLLPPLTIRSNPVDMAFARNEEIFEESAQRILEDKGVDVLVVFLLYHPFMTPGRIAVPVFRLRQLSGKPIVLCANSPHGMVDGEVSNFEANGVPVYRLPDRALRALKALIDYGKVSQRNRSGLALEPVSP
jgi:acetyl-CoA synthetase (ADP-forming)